MLEWVTRTTTSPGERSSRLSCSNRARMRPPSSWIRNALKEVIRSSPLSAGRPAALGPMQPDQQALRVQLEVGLELMRHFGTTQPAALALQQRPPQLEHRLTNGGVRILRSGQLARDPHQLLDLLLQHCAQSRDTGHAAVMHEVDGLGCKLQQTVDGGSELLRIEL